MDAVHSFTKAERLCSRKATEELFTSGNRSLTAFPLRVVYRQIEPGEQHQTACQILISVSKRHFKHAVDRNRTKRQLREAWRLNRDILLRSLNMPLHIAFIWLSDDLQPTALVQRKMKNLLHRMAEEYDGLCTSEP